MTTEAAQSILVDESHRTSFNYFWDILFAGNPMMVRVPDGGVDAVIELQGQAVYDAIPGLYIAQKAGAFVGDLEGNALDEAYLGKKLQEQVQRAAQGTAGAEPDGRDEVMISYILAANKPLYEDLLGYLSR